MTVLLAILAAELNRYHNIHRNTILAASFSSVSAMLPSLEPYAALPQAKSVKHDSCVLAQSVPALACCGQCDHYSVSNCIRSMTLGMGLLLGQTRLPSTSPAYTNHELRKMAALQAAVRALLSLYVLVAAAQGAVRDDGYFTKLAGPPSEFTDFATPSSVSVAATSEAFGLPTAQLTVTASHWSHPLPVDDAEILTIIILYQGPDVADVRVSAKDPSGNLVNPTLQVDEDFGINGNSYPSKSIAFENPAAGEWTVMLDLLDAHTNLPVPVYTIASYSNSNYKVWGTVTDESLVTGEEVTVEAMIPLPSSMDDHDSSTKPVPTLGVVKDAVLTITQPDGDRFSKPMENPENDGLFQASFIALQSGTFNARVDVFGSGGSGQSFVRTLWYLFHVADPVLRIAPQPAHAEMVYHKAMDTSVVYILVPVIWDSTADNVFRGFAEVWGTGVGGDIVPVAWVSGLLPIKDKEGYNATTNYFLQFDLDETWLDKAQAKPPLYLKNVTFDERANFITLAFAKSMKVVTTDRKLLARQPREPATEITYEMRNGYNPYRYLKQNSSETGKLILVHGYCAHETPFTLEDFTDFEVFEDFDQNRLNDAFAQKIAEFADSKGITKFSLYSHSQGGFAALHLNTYYQTGLANSVSRQYSLYALFVCKETLYCVYVYLAYMVHGVAPVWLLILTKPVFAVVCTPVLKVQHILICDS